MNLEANDLLPFCLQGNTSCCKHISKTDSLRSFYSLLTLHQLLFLSFPKKAKHFWGLIQTVSWWKTLPKSYTHMNPANLTINQRFQFFLLL